MATSLEPILLLLGSGVSMPSGLPDSATLTNAILMGRFYQHTDQSFYPIMPAIPTPRFGLEIAETTQGFLRMLHAYAERYYAFREIASI